MRFQLGAMVIVAVASAVCSAQGDETSPRDEVKTLTVAVVSSHSQFCDVEANLKHFEWLIKEAKGQGARLVCFPELALMAYSAEKEILNVAEENYSAKLKSRWEPRNTRITRKKDGFRPPAS
jgi:hypothetical protein